MSKEHQKYSPARFLNKIVRCVREQRVPYFLTRLNIDVIKVWFWRQPGLIKFKEYSDQRGLERVIQQDDRRRLKWRIARSVPRKLYDAGGAQIGHLLYVIGGYTNLNVVSDQIFTFDMKSRRWHQLVSIPKEMAHSHLGICVENERYIYIISGQRGAQCAPAVCDSFVFDAKLLRWSSLPPLPAPRYAPIAEIVDGRLHIAGGSGEDRVTPAKDHWSIAVEDGQALETGWRKEPPIPRGGPHRGSRAVDGHIYVFGGQEGDFRAIEGDPRFTCTRETQEFYHPECYRYIPAQQRWERLADMPVTASHTDYSVLRWRDYILVIGGQVHKNADDFFLTLSDCIQAYDLKTHTWSDFGRLPYRIKAVVAGIWEDTLFVATGQRDTSASNPKPEKVINHCWQVNLNLLTTNHDETNPNNKQSLKGFMVGKKVFLVSHNLSRTGAPLLLVRLGEYLRDNGAQVEVTTLKYDDAPGSLFHECGITTVPPEWSFWKASQADLVVANTCGVCVKDWVCAYLARFPEAAEHLVWYIHENKTAQFCQNLEETGRVGAVVFDSLAAEKDWRDNGLRFPQKMRIIHPFLRESIRWASERKSYPFSDEGPGFIHFPTDISRSQIRRRLGVERETMLVTMIATYCDYKGQDLLTCTIGKMISENPTIPIRLLLVGFHDESQRQTYLRHLNEYEHRAVGCKRAVTVKKDLAAYYAASDVFVMNTQESGETFGMVTLEAMAFGLPVLGTDAGGTRDIIEAGKTGDLFPVGPSGQRELEKWLYDLLKDSKKMRQMGETARRRVLERFTPEKFFAQWEGLIREII